MRLIALVVACVADVAHAHRVQLTSPDLLSSLHREHHSLQKSGNPLELLASFLHALNPASAFNPFQGVACSLVKNRNCEIACATVLSSWWRLGPLLKRTQSPKAESEGVVTSWEVDTLIFDVDDTLYPGSCGFSEHRMGQVTKRFMLEQLGFESPDEAMSLWSEYIKRYHSTLKGLAVADQEGRLPQPFREEELGKYWADNCDFASYIAPDDKLSNALETLQSSGLKLVAFSNAPRLYVLRALDALGLRQFFPDERVFGVEDVMPACKPEHDAFNKVLSAVGSQADRSVMFEDSMKNVRACRAMGMHTVLIKEGADVSGEAELVGDVPDPEDPAVGAVLAQPGDVLDALPDLLQGRFHGKYPVPS